MVPANLKTVKMSKNALGPGNIVQVFCFGGFMELIKI